MNPNQDISLGQIVQNLFYHTCCELMVIRFGNYEGVEGVLEHTVHPIRQPLQSQCPNNKTSCPPRVVGQLAFF